MGGEQKVARQHAAGRLTVRERIDALLDPDSFHEVGALAGKAQYEGAELTDFRPANFVMGRGRIDGRRVVVAGDDFTVRGGAADASIFQKQVHAEQMANELRLALVRLVDGTGGGGSVKSLEDMALTYVPRNPGWEWVVQNMATVPIVALALGPVAGLGAARVVTSHYSLMVRGTSQVFVAGPPVVKRLGEDVDKEQLGGSHIHARNGTVDDEVESEKDAFEATRRFLSYLPSSVHEAPPRGERADDVDRREEWLIEAIPRDRRQPYKMRAIIDAVVDRESFFEIGKLYGRSAITGLARFAWPSGDWGSLPLEGGIEAAYRAQLEAAEDPEVLRREIEQRLDAVRSPFRTAEAFLIEEIIDPRDTRPLLCEFAELTAPLRGTGPMARPMRP